MFPREGMMFSCSNFSSKPLWDVIANLVSNVPLPTPGKERVLFAIENSLLALEVPPKDGFPHADVCHLLLFASMYIYVCVYKIGFIL